MSGFFFCTRGLWLVAGGAIGAVATLGLDKLTRKVRPAAVGVVREGYSLKEWAAGKFGKVRGDIDDLVSEAVREYQKDKETSGDTTRREKELLEKIDRIIEERLSRIEAQKKEGEK